MHNPKQSPRGWTLFVGTIALATLIHLLHEAAHALTAIAFGVSGSMGTNTVRYAADISDTAALWSNVAGPGLMVLFAIAAAASRWRWAPTVLFIVFVQRLLAGGFSAFLSPNDEARIGALIGIGEWPVFALTIGITGYLFIRRYLAEALGWKWIAISFVGFNIAITAVVFGDNLLPRIAF